MKCVSKSLLALAASSLLAVTAIAQTQNIPVPASSAYTGGYAVVGITIPPSYSVGDITWIVNQGLNGGSIVAPKQADAQGTFCGQVTQRGSDGTYSAGYPCNGSWLVSNYYWWTGTYGSAACPAGYNFLGTGIGPVTIVSGGGDASGQYSYAQYDRYLSCVKA